MILIAICRRSSRLREQRAEPGQVPEVVDAIQRGEERDPVSPADVHQNSLGAAEGTGDERGSGGIHILPSGPLVMAAMDALPATEGDQSRKSQPPNQRVHAEPLERKSVPCPHS